ncbi:MAG: site-specific integrase [Gemmatimonadetes bacterium]|nr:site-specific integrase [Gemmatimonadota bacterium]
MPWFDVFPSSVYISHERRGLHASTHIKTSQFTGIACRPSGLLRQIESELKIRYYAQKTRRNYLGHIRRFFFWLRGAPVPDDPESIKRYLLFLVEHKEVSSASLHNCHSALRFLYREILHRDQVIAPIKRPRCQRRLPVVFNPEEVKELLANAGNLKHRMLLSLIYAGSLRVGEAVRLKPGGMLTETKLKRTLSDGSSCGKYI